MTLKEEKMADSFVIMYELHDKGHNHSQVAEVCASLELAQKWLREEPKGKAWAKLAKIEGEGLNMRLVTNFSEGNWSAYSIRKTNYVG